MGKGFATRNSGCGGPCVAFCPHPQSEIKKIFGGFVDVKRRCGSLSPLSHGSHRKRVRTNKLSKTHVKSLNRSSPGSGTREGFRAVRFTSGAAGGTNSRGRSLCF